MAVITTVAAADMAVVFAGGGTAVVTTGAAADDIHMVDARSRFPGIHSMTVGAIGRGFNMVAGLGLCLYPR